MSGTMEYVDMERADDGLLPGAARESQSSAMPQNTRKPSAYIALELKRKAPRRTSGMAR